MPNYNESLDCNIDIPQTYHLPIKSEACADLTPSGLVSSATTQFRQELENMLLIGN